MRGLLHPEGGPDDGTTTWTYRRAEPGRVAAGRERDDGDGGLSAGGDRGADVLCVETEIPRAWFARTPAAAGRTHQAETAGGGSLARSPDVAGERPKKAVRPRARCARARWAQTTDQVSERRGSRLLPMARASLRDQSPRDPQEAVRMRLRKVAASRMRFGYRRVTVLLRRDGWRVNANRIYRGIRKTGSWCGRRTACRRPWRRRQTSGGVWIS